MAPRETATVDQLERHLVRRWGAYVLKLHGSAMAIGRLDLVCSVRGYFVAIEVKAPGAARGMTPRQAAERRRILARGGFAFSASTVSDVDRELVGFFDAKHLAAFDASRP